ncbi:hypothetical protein J2TS4_36920 [Paenibacillus sp. J2TS4]|nr:hypothetical protein J2TS4_36920 [Paenibacillus sp. J2TS4]
MACVGVASASELTNKSLSEMTSKPVQEVLRNPEEAAESIINDYFTAIMEKRGANGIPLMGFRIVGVDSSDLDDIKVTVTL